MISTFKALEIFQESISFNKEIVITFESGIAIRRIVSGIGSIDGRLEILLGDDGALFSPIEDDYFFRIKSIEFYEKVKPISLRAQRLRRQNKIL